MTLTTLQTDAHYQITELKPHLALTEPVPQSGSTATQLARISLK
jgi:hypothetical protein